jgi:hypothetical protein
VIKLKDILNEALTWENRKFGDRLPTLTDYKEAKEATLNEATPLDKAYDDWHDASVALQKLVRKTKDPKLMKAFSQAWGNADEALIKWFEEQGY